MDTNTYPSINLTHEHTPTDTHAFTHGRVHSHTDTRIYTHANAHTSDSAICLFYLNSRMIASYI